MEVQAHEIAEMIRAHVQQYGSGNHETLALRLHAYMMAHMPQQPSTETEPEHDDRATE